MGIRVAMVGCGAVGGFTAGHMARNGVDVTLIDAWPDHVAKMNRDGVSLRGVTEAESFDVPVRAIGITQVQDLQKEGPFDVAFISTKSYESQFAASLIKDYLAPRGFVVSLQNAINEERIASVVGWHRVVGCIASSISAELEAPALIQRHVPLRGDSYTVFRAGEVHGRITWRVELVAELMRHTDSAMTTRDLWGERWSKLVINSSHNGLSAATGLGGNGMATHDAARRVQIRMSAETIQVGQALGHVLQVKKGTQPAQWIAAANGDAKAMQDIEDILLAETKSRGDGQRPSMGQDMQKGRKTEIAEINGHVVAKGAAVGIATPLNAAMVALVQRCERGDIVPDPKNIETW
jgi:2-dehydropantoate 2-reductase